MPSIRQVNQTTTFRLGGCVSIGGRLRASFLKGNGSGGRKRRRIFFSLSLQAAGEKTKSLMLRSGTREGRERGAVFFFFLRVNKTTKIKKSH